MKERFKQKIIGIKERFNLKKENVIPIIISVVVASIPFLDSKYFNNYLTGIMWVIVLLVLAIALLSIMIVAGFTVIKSLFRISAGLSLLIFLAQEYCSAPHSVQSEDALKGLLGIGFLYMLFDFFHSLYKALIILNKKTKDKKWSLGKIISVIFFILFACSFIYAIYQVINPIVLNLCVYKTP